jgi:hypothetical protein
MGGLTIIDQPDRVFYKDAVGGTKNNRLRVVLSRSNTCDTTSLWFTLLQIDTHGQISPVADQSILRMFPIDTSIPDQIVIEFCITRVSQRQNKYPYALKISTTSETIVTDPIIVKSKRNLRRSGYPTNHKVEEWRQMLQTIIQSCQALDHNMQQSPSQTLDPHSASIFDTIDE